MWGIKLVWPRHVFVVEASLFGRSLVFGRYSKTIEETPLGESRGLPVRQNRNAPEVSRKKQARGLERQWLHQLLLPVLLSWIFSASSIAAAELAHFSGARPPRFYGELSIRDSEDSAAIEFYWLRTGDNVHLRFITPDGRSPDVELKNPSGAGKSDPGAWILREIQRATKDMALRTTVPIQPKDRICRFSSGAGFFGGFDFSIHANSNPREYAIVENLFHSLLRQAPEEISSMCPGSLVGRLRIEDVATEESALDAPSPQVSITLKGAGSKNQANQGLVTTLQITLDSKGSPDLLYHEQEELVFRDACRKSDAATVVKKIMEERSHLPISFKNLDHWGEACLRVNDYPGGSGFQIRYMKPIDFERPKYPGDSAGYDRFRNYYVALMNLASPDSKGRIFLPKTDEEIRNEMSEAAEREQRLIKSGKRGLEKALRSGKPLWEAMESKGRIDYPEELVVASGSRPDRLLYCRRFPATVCERWGIGNEEKELLVAAFPEATFEKESEVGAVWICDPSTGKSVDVWRPSEPADIYRNGEVQSRRFNGMRFGASVAFSPDNRSCIVGCGSGGKGFFLDLETGNWSVLTRDLFLRREMRGGRWAVDNRRSPSGSVRGTFWGNSAFKVAGSVRLPEDGLSQQFHGARNFHTFEFGGSVKSPADLFAFADKWSDGEDKEMDYEDRIMASGDRNRLSHEISIFLSRGLLSEDAIGFFRADLSGLYDFSRLSPDGRSRVPSVVDLPEPPRLGSPARSAANGRQTRLITQIASGDMAIFAIEVPTGGRNLCRTYLTSANNNPGDYPLKWMDAVDVTSESSYRPVEMGWIDERLRTLWVTVDSTVPGQPPLLVLADWREGRRVGIPMNDAAKLGRAVLADLGLFVTNAGTHVECYDLNEFLRKLADP